MANATDRFSLGVLICIYLGGRYFISLALWDVSFSFFFTFACPRISS